MFDNSIKTEPIPERIFSLCHAVANKQPIDEKQLESLIVVDSLNTARTSYFRPVLEAAKELKLVGKDDNNNLIFIGQKESIKNLHAFRRYCNSVVFLDPSTDFYKIISQFLFINDEWLKYGSVTTSNEVVSVLNEVTDIPSQKLQKDVILGIRFWINFLGFGYFQENTKTFLPNMYTALHDFLALGHPERNKEYSVDEFISILFSGASVALKGSKESLKLNFAMSNALRLMHDNKEIELKRNLDSKKVWHLFNNPEHEFVSDITHIVIKKEMK